MSELKPCPFCGKNEARVVGAGLFTGQCQFCGAQTHLLNSREAAVKRWNERAPQPPPPATPPPRDGCEDCAEAAEFGCDLCGDEMCVDHAGHHKEHCPKLAPPATPGLLASARALVDAQAEDVALWAPAATAPEAYVQRALRALHAAVEAASTPLDALGERRAGMRSGLTEAANIVAERMQAEEMESYAWIALKQAMTAIRRARDHLSTPTEKPPGEEKA